MKKIFEQETFSHRYIIKILSSLLIALLNVIVQLLLPRVFTIKEYGYYSYNLNVFTSIVTIFNLSASDALVSKFAKNNEEKGYVIFYLQLFSIISILLNITITILFPTSLIKKSFAGQTLCIMLLGLNVVIVRKLLTDMVSIFDAMALSKIPAFWQIIQKILISLGVIGGYFCGLLNLFVFYVLQIATLLFVSIILIFIFFYYHKTFYQIPRKKIITEYIKEFFIFCKPLVCATGISQIIIIIKNWALMHWSGISSSALFGAAWQLNIIISYVFSPYAELMKREFAVIHDNEVLLRHRLSQSLKIMAWLISFLCIFVVVYATDILTVLFGDKYSNAIIVTQLIMIYTIYQAWGQIVGSFMLAAERTRAYSIISIAVNVFSIILLYVFQCPNPIWHNGLGAIGMGWSYVIGNIFSVTIMLLFIAKRINMKFMKLYIIPFIAMLVCSVIAFIIQIMFARCFIGNELLYRLARIICGGFMYTIVIFLIIRSCPQIMGINKEALIEKISYWKNKR